GTYGDTCGEWRGGVHKRCKNPGQGTSVNALISSFAYVFCEKNEATVMDIYELIAQKRTDILALADRFAVKNIRIFGSVARREATGRSDIDFLVEFPPGTSLLTHAAFQRELRELLGRDVDVASVNGIRENFRKTVMQEAVPL
ncbi:nucleotidyltransferase family protein, partial [Methanoregula sp.]|uniref:nucleotidyltransferase family protein n=1 Tax=Methanoregula sp. TaxID=2052170 RepID=UPI003BAE2ECF